MDVDCHCETGYPGLSYALSRINLRAPPKLGLSLHEIRPSQRNGSPITFASHEGTVHDSRRTILVRPENSICTKTKITAQHQFSRPVVGRDSFPVDDLRPHLQQEWSRAFVCVLSGFLFLSTTAQGSPCTPSCGLRAREHSTSTMIHIF